MIRRRLLAVCCIETLAFLAAPDVLADALVLGPERLVDDPVLSPVLETRSAKVEFGGPNHLAVWSDPRGGIGDRDPDSSIFAARVTPDGTVLDPTGIVVSDGSGIAQDWTGLVKGHPAVAFDGTNYLVVWMDARSGVAEVYGARVSPAGDVLDPAGFRISIDPIDPAERPAAPSGQEDPTVAFDGTRFLVAWSDARGSLISGRDIYAAHVTTQGTVVESGGFVINEDPGDQVLPLAAAAGSQSVVTWTTSTSTGVFAARVSAEGAVLDAPPIVLSPSVVEASVLYPKRSVAADPSGYLVVWCASNPEVALCDVTARKLATGGQLAEAVIAAPAVFDVIQLAAGYDGGRFVVVWGDYSGQASAMRIASDGALLDGTGGVPAAGLPPPSDLAFGGGRFLVVGGSSALAAVTLDAGATPTVGPSVTVASAANVQSIPAAAFDGSGYLVTWLDYRTTSGALMGSRLDPDGATRDPIPVTIADNASSLGAVHFPAMASNGADFMVGWRGLSLSMGGGPSVMVRAVTGAGEAPAPATAIPSSDAYAPKEIAMGFGGTAYSIFWSEMGPTPVRAGIRAARLSPSAALLGQATIAAVLPSTRPAVACAPNHCLLAYTEAPTNGPSPMYTAPGAIRGVFVDDALAKGAFFTIAAGTNDPQQSPQVAFDGTNWLVTWQDAAGHTLRGARVDTNGTVLDTAPVVIAQNQTLGKTTLSFDGTDYLVAWESNGLRLARITTGGTLMDPGGVAGPAGGAAPSLAGRLLAYSRPVGGRGRVVVRVRVPAPVVEDGGVPPADGGVDGAPTDTGADEGSEGGAVADAGTDAGPPAADAAADAVPDDAGNGGESGGHHHWPPHRWGCSVAPSDSALAPWATLLFALVIAKVRRRGASAAANAPPSVA